MTLFLLFMWHNISLPGVKYLHSTIFQVDGKSGIPEQLEQAKIKKLTCPVCVH